MIILGGEPPVEENKDPHLGGLLSSLNALRYKLENNIIEDNGVIQDNLNYLAGVVASWVTLHQTPTDQHIAQVGLVHGETIETVKLEKVDNFRTAVIPTDYDNNVSNAFVTPAGMKSKIQTSLIGYDTSIYQQNTRLPFAFLHHIDQFKRAAKDPWTIPYFKPGPCTLIMNSDRVIVSPAYETSFAGPYSMFYSDTVKSLNALSLSEERMIANYYTGTGWNMKGAMNSAGQIGIFRPLANKGVYDYASTIPSSGNTYVVLSSTFGDITHKGCLISCSIANNVLSLGHYFFGVNDPENNPTLTQIVTTAYKAVYNTVNMANVTDAIQKTRSIRLLDFFTTGPGVIIESALATGDNPTITADWRVQDKEFLMNVSLPVKITIGTTVVNKILTFTESVHPGKLVINDVGSIASLIPFTVDSITTVDDLANCKWLVDVVDDNLLDLVSAPGVINENGLVVNAFATRNSLRMKLIQTEYEGVIPLLEDPSITYPASDANTQIFTPTRHFSFGDLSERVIPISGTANRTVMLSYCLANDKGSYIYKELGWDNSLIHTVVGSPATRYGVNTPDNITERDIAVTTPKSLVSISQMTGEVSLNGLCFTDANQFTGYASVAYNNGAWVLGAKVTLDTVSQLVMNLHMASFKQNSSALGLYGGNADNYPREFSQSIFALPNNRALCIWSDGLVYLEACLTTYTLTANVFTLNLSSADTRYQISNATQVNSGTRTSKSNDNLYSYHSDLLVYQAGNEMKFVLNRAFGKVAGDVSFWLSDYTATAPGFNRTYTTPAKLYNGSSSFDVASEVYPPVVIPKVGIFQNRSNSGTDTTMTSPNATPYFDPYRPAAAKFVIVPEGYRCVINGLAIKIAEAMEVSYTTSPAYFYLEENFGVVELIASNVMLPPDNNALLIAQDLDGTGVVYTRSYIVLDKHLISSERHGRTIPMVVDDGTVRGSTDFFQYVDVIRDR